MASGALIKCGRARQVVGSRVTSLSSVAPMSEAVSSSSRPTCGVILWLWPAQGAQPQEERVGVGWVGWGATPIVGLSSQSDVLPRPTLGTPPQDTCIPLITVPRPRTKLSYHLLLRIESLSRFPVRQVQGLPLCVGLSYDTRTYRSAATIGHFVDTKCILMINLLF